MINLKTKSIALPCHSLLLRYSATADDTLGLFYINGQFQHYIIEDEYRKVKVKGETRIPAGVYELSLRKEGGFHQRYSNHKSMAIREMHEGMVHLKNVPGFDYILYHIMNHDEDTDGCIGGGDHANNNQLMPGYVSASTNAYIRTYPKLRDYIKENETPVIQIIEFT